METLKDLKARHKRMVQSGNFIAARFVKDEINRIEMLIAQLGKEACKLGRKNARHSYRNNIKVRLARNPQPTAKEAE